MIESLKKLALKKRVGFFDFCGKNYCVLIFVVLLLVWKQRGKFNMPYKTSDKKSGDTVYGRKVINSIILLAAKEIAGVASLYGRGFRTEFNGLTVDVDVYINVVSDISCSDVAHRVQENIKRNVESMSAFKVGIVNVNILGVVFNEEKVGG